MVGDNAVSVVVDARKEKGKRAREKTDAVWKGMDGLDQSRLLSMAVVCSTLSKAIFLPSLKIMACFMVGPSAYVDQLARATVALLVLLPSGYLAICFYGNESL